MTGITSQYHIGICALLELSGLEFIDRPGWSWLTQSPGKRHASGDAGAEARTPAHPLICVIA